MRFDGDDLPLTLDGLELEQARVGSSLLRQAVEATLSELQAMGLLSRQHYGLAILTLDLADAVDAGKRSGRASAAAMAAGELRETLLSLPQPQVAGEAEQYAELRARLEQLR